MLFVIVAVLICLFPIYGTFIDRNVQLQGVASAGGQVPTDIKSIWTGEAQNALESKLKGRIPGRTTLIRMYSQYMYSIFNSSSNSNIVIGSRHSLYEPEYLCDFLNLWPEMREDAHDDLIKKLNQLNSILEREGKKLYVFITPSKVRYDYSNIPWFYRALTKPKMRTNYDRFIRKLRATSIDFFDSIDYIDEVLSDNIIFYSSGIHWGNGAAALVTSAMLEDMKADTGFELGSLAVNLVDSENGMDPDQDLLSILNLYFHSNEDTYKIPEYSYTSGADHPNVLMRGGSFMGQSLFKLIDMGVFDRSVYFQNDIVITDKTDIRTLSGFDAYEEIDVADMASMADLVILEVNEEKIWIMGWGFIDELINVFETESEISS